MTRDAPLMLAANREEYFDRPFDGPTIRPTPPRVLCGTDRRAGGTWLGVNQQGVVVAVTNRPKSEIPAQPRSRGALCLDLLTRATAYEAAQQALAELHTGHYAGANYVLLDRQQAYVISSGDELREAKLDPGVHIIANSDLDDPHDMRQQYARALLAPRFPRSPDEFLTVSRAILSTGMDAEEKKTIVVRTPHRGTVCSTLLTLGQRPEAMHYLYAPGPPDQSEYQDLSATLRELLAT